MSRRELLPGIAGVVTVLLAWELVARGGGVPAFYLPPATRVAKTLADTAFLNFSIRQLALTILRAMGGYALAAAIAIPLGIAIGRIPLVHAVTRPILEFLRPLPASGIAPVALLFLGIGSGLHVFVVTFGSLWPILVASIQGASTVDRRYLETARLLRLDQRRTLVSVVFPAALPHIMAGLRTSLSVALILAVTVEMIVGSNGIGFAILDFERGFRVAEMYGELMILGVAGVILDATFRLLQHKALYWVY